MTFPTLLIYQWGKLTLTVYFNDWADNSFPWTDNFSKFISNTDSREQLLTPLLRVQDVPDCPVGPQIDETWVVYVALCT